MCSATCTFNNRIIKSLSNVVLSSFLLNTAHDLSYYSIKKDLELTRLKDC